MPSVGIRFPGPITEIPDVPNISAVRQRGRGPSRIHFWRSCAVTPKEVLALIREKEVKCVDLRFMDFPGLWQHFTIPAEALSESVFEEGLGFDGSSIRGWQAINESDMLVIPQAETAFMD